MIREFDRGEQFAADCDIRQTVCTIQLQSGDGGKSARDAALSRSMRTGESYLATDSLNPTGYSPRGENTVRFTVGADFVHPSPR
jgi:hypothetical protein